MPAVLEGRVVRRPRRCSSPGSRRPAAAAQQLRELRVAVRVDSGARVRGADHVEVEVGGDLFSLARRRVSARSGATRAARAPRHPRRRAGCARPAAAGRSPRPPRAAWPRRCRCRSGRGRSRRSRDGRPPSRRARPSRRASPRSRSACAGARRSRRRRASPGRRVATPAPALTIRAGMRVPTPPSVADGTSPPSLSTTSSAPAPDRWAFCALTRKKQLPRSARAISPSPRPSKSEPSQPSPTPRARPAARPEPE